MKKLLADISKCVVCEKYLELGCNPILTSHTKSKIAVIGQAPGKKVHLSGIPWDDKSGENLRSWMNGHKRNFMI